MASAYLRVPVVLRAMFRLLDGPDAVHLYSGAPFNSSRMREELLTSSSRPEALLRFMAEMDRKLDALLSLAQRESLQNDFPLRGHIVELGGNGGRLESPEELGERGGVEALLLLEECPMRVISVLAGFKRLPETSRTGRDKAVYELSFTDIEEEDREHIIRFVFSIERRRIRRGREQDPDAFS